MSQIESFSERVEAFLKRTGIAASRFGEEAVGDRSFVEDLRAGRSPRLVTADRVDAYMQRMDRSPVTASEKSDATDKNSLGPKSKKNLSYSKQPGRDKRRRPE